MHDIRFLDETLDINKTHLYHLSIQAGPDGFSYVIFDPSRYKYIALKHYGFREEIPEYKYPDHLNDLLKKDEFLQKDYAGIRCIWNNPRTTLLPSALFEKDRLKQYFEFNQVLNDPEELHANPLKDPDAYLIFPIHHEIANVFIKQYPLVKFFNQATPFIEYCLNHYKDGPDSVYVNICRNFSDILVIKNHSLVLHNTFHYRTEQDLVYFILNIYEKVSLDPGLNPVYLAGFLEKNSSRINTIRKFIRPVHFCESDQRFQYSHVLDRIPEHNFISLFNLYHCA